MVDKIQMEALHFYFNLFHTPEIHRPRCEAYDGFIIYLVLRFQMNPCDHTFCISTFCV